MSGGVSVNELKKAQLINNNAGTQAPIYVNYSDLEVI